MRLKTENSSQDLQSSSKVFCQTLCFYKSVQEVGDEEGDNK